MIFVSSAFWLKESSSVFLLPRFCDFILCRGVIKFFPPCTTLPPQAESRFSLKVERGSLEASRIRIFFPPSFLENRQTLNLCRLPRSARQSCHDVLQARRELSSLFFKVWEVYYLFFLVVISYHSI